MSSKVDIQNQGWICAHIAVESARSTLQCKNYRRICKEARVDLDVKLHYPRTFFELKSFLNDKELIIQLRAIEKLDSRLRENNAGKDYKSFRQVYEHGKDPVSDTHSKNKLQTLQTRIGVPDQKQLGCSPNQSSVKQPESQPSIQKLENQHYWRNKVKRSKSTPNLSKSEHI